MISKKKYFIFILSFRGSAEDVLGYSNLKRNVRSKFEQSRFDRFIYYDDVKYKSLVKNDKETIGEEA